MTYDSQISISRRPLEIVLAEPRGFCAGVVRAIAIVEAALEKWGAPVFVRHQIVHNARVQAELEAKGAVFVEDVEDCPGDRPIIISAHGASPQVFDEARAAASVLVDATCPLVARVHARIKEASRAGRDTILIGHAGHQEVTGSLGQAEPGRVHLVETLEDAHALSLPAHAAVSLATQTTLSRDETQKIEEILSSRFPALIQPKHDDICYATTNRQGAIKALSREIDTVLVIGCPNSSNTNRLVETARNTGKMSAFLVPDRSAIPWHAIEGVSALGVTAGASAPEVIMQEVLEALSQRYDIRIKTLKTTNEGVRFPMPDEVS